MAGGALGTHRWLERMLPHRRGGLLPCRMTLDEDGYRDELLHLMAGGSMATGHKP